MSKNAPVSLLMAFLVIASLLVAVAHPAAAYPRPGATEIVTTPSDGSFSYGRYGVSNSDIDMTADGRYVVFATDAPLVPQDTVSCVTSSVVNCNDIYVKDRRTGRTIMLSVTKDGQPGTTHSWNPSISDDGRFVAFETRSGNLVDGDTNGRNDIFVHDRDVDGDNVFDEPGEISLVRASVSTEGKQGTGTSSEGSIRPSISGDGRFVAFESRADNLVPNDTNLSADVFVRDLDAQTTVRISVGADGSQAERRNPPGLAKTAITGKQAISSDGRHVLFQSDSLNLVQGQSTGNYVHVFLRDRDTDGNGIFDEPGGSTTIQVDVDPSGKSGSAGHSGAPLFGTHGAALSNNGRFVAFQTEIDNLAPGEANLHDDVYVRDRDADGDGVFDEIGARDTTRVSVTSSGAEVLRGGSKPSISPDGRFVSFMSHQYDVLPNDTNNRPDIFVHDRHTGATERVSVASDGGESNHNSPTASPLLWESHAAAAIISDGGRYVAFTSQASNLVPGQSKNAGDYSEVFVRDRGPAIGARSLDAVVSSGQANVSGTVNLSGVVLSSGSDPASDSLPGAREISGELTGARVIYRPELEDLLIDIDVAHMPQTITYPRGSLTPGVTHALELTVDGIPYEVRATGPFGTTAHLASGSENSALGPGDRKVTTGIYELYECSAVCVQQETLQGGLGVTGNRVRIAVPLASVGTKPGVSVTDVRAVAAVVAKTPGPAEWDAVELADGVVPEASVSLGIAGEDVPLEDVVFEPPLETGTSSGDFSGTLDVSGLIDGYYKVWAKGCLGAEACGSTPTDVTIGSPDPRPTPTPTVEPTSEPTVTPTPTNGPTSGPTPTPSPTPTLKPTPTPTPTPTPSAGRYPTSPSDTYFGALWGTRKVKAPAAWQEPRATGFGIKVAVIDSGTDLQHEDLQCSGKLLVIPGSDVVDGDNDPDDKFGHGTHVSGTIGACTNNRKGIAGVAPDSKIMPIRVLDASGSGSFEDIAEGIKKANEAGAHIINLSLSGDAISAVPIFDFRAVDEAISDAVSNGVVVVAAAGNSGIPVCEYPSLADDVICVGATDPRDLKAWYSSFPNKTGSGATLVAPGGTGGQGVCALYEEHIFSLYPKELDRCDEDRVGYQDTSGTSMAAPHVSGAAALIYSRLAGVRNETNAGKVVAALESTATDLGVPGWDPIFGSGLIDAHAAVTSVPVATLPDPDPTGTPDPDPTEQPSLEPQRRTRRVSETASGAVANDYSFHPSFSADGNHVAFTSTASNLMTGVPQPGCPGSGISCTDIFVKDLRNGKVRVVSIASDGTLGNAGSNRAALSADGSVVVFDSAATNLVPGDTNFLTDVFVHDRDTDKDGILDEPGAISTTRASVAEDGTQMTGSDRVIDLASISPDGRYVAFASNSAIFDPADTNGRYDVFLYDREVGTFERVSGGMDGAQGDANASIVGVPSAVSEGGRYVAFYSDSANLVPGDTNHENPLLLGDRRRTTAAGFDVFVRDTEQNRTTRISVASDGDQLPGLFTGAFFTSISGDGRHVAFASLISTKLTPQDGNTTNDIYVRDRDTDGNGVYDEPEGVSTRRVNVASDGSEANAFSEQPTMSAGGRYVAFLSAADNLVPDDHNNAVDAFVHDLKTGITERVSVTSTGSELDADAHVVTISGDGRRAAFWTQATNLPGRPGRDYDIVYVRDRGPAVGVSELTASLEGDQLAFAGWANLKGATFVSVNDPRNDGSPAASAAGGQILGADLVYQGESNDLILRTKLASLPSVDPFCCVNVNMAASPGLTYGIQFISGDIRYEARATAASGSAPLFELYECVVACLKVRDLEGSYGTTGPEVSLVIPRAAIGAGDGDVLTETSVFVTGGPRVYAGAPLGNSADVGYQLDSITLNEVTLPAEKVSLGLAPAGTDPAEVEFPIDVTQEVTDHLFSDQLDLSSLPDGDYELWAKACLGQECGASSVPVLLGDATKPERATSLAFDDLSAVTGQYSDEVLIEARLSKSSGDAIEGAEVIFELVGAEDNVVVSAVTDQSGTASKRVVLSMPPGSYVLRARFEGVPDRFDPAANHVSFVIEKEDSNLNLSEEGRGSNRTLFAELSDLDSPIVGLGDRVITFFADGQEIGTAVTDRDGIAFLGVPPRYRGGKHDFEAVFIGDEFYRQSRGAI